MLVPRQICFWAFCYFEHGTSCLLNFRTVPEVVQAGPFGGQPVPQLPAGWANHAIIQLWTYLSAASASHLPASHVVSKPCNFTTFWQLAYLHLLAFHVVSESHNFMTFWQADYLYVPIFHLVSKSFSLTTFCWGHLLCDNIPCGNCIIQSYIFLLRLPPTYRHLSPHVVSESLNFTTLIKVFGVN